MKTIAESWREKLDALNNARLQGLEFSSPEHDDLLEVITNTEQEMAGQAISASFDPADVAHYKGQMEQAEKGWIPFRWVDTPLPVSFTFNDGSTITLSGDERQVHGYGPRKKEGYDKDHV